MKKITLLFMFNLMVTFVFSQNPSLQFNGTDNVIDWAESDGVLKDSENHTWEMWVKGSATTVGVIYTEGWSGSAFRAQYRVNANGAGKVEIEFRNYAGTYLIPNNTVSTTTVFDDTWHHIAIVETTTTGTTSTVLYVDGVADATDFGSYTRPTLWDNTDGGALNHSVIGQITRAGDRAVNANFTWYDGEIDEFRAWKRALDVTEIAVNTCAPANTTNLHRHVRFNETSGTDFNDEITSTNETLLGTTTAANYTTNSRAATWTGTTDSDWGTGSNWNTTSVPTSTSMVLIPSGITNYPTISTGTGVTVNHLTIKSGATLIAEGTSTVAGNVTYNRNLSFTSGNTEGWHLVGSPVTGQAYDNAYATVNTLATSGTKRGIATYNNGVATGNWAYLEDDDSNSGTFGKGTGYSIKTSATADISFTGTLNTTDPEIKGITIGAGTPFNLISNPYTSHINSKTFLQLAANTAKLTSEQIWVWNPSTKNYDSKLSGDVTTFIIAPGQAFFVSCSTPGDLEFVESNQVHSATDTFLKSSSKPEIQLNITDGELNRYAKVNYNENATKGFDNGYDGETFNGVANKLDVFTQLLTDNQGKNYQIQSLPNSDLELMVIPVGLKSDAGKEIIFSAETLNLPNGIKVFLEDRENNIFTRLDEANSTYKVIPTGTIDGIGRFYLHTKSSALSTNVIELNDVSIYKTTNSTLRITGLKQGTSTVKLFNIVGKLMMNSSFSSNGVKDISLPKLATGVYIVQLTTEDGKLNKKIILE